MKLAGVLSSFLLFVCFSQAVPVPAGGVESELVPLSGPSYFPPIISLPRYSLTRGYVNKTFDLYSIHPTHTIRAFDVFPPLRLQFCPTHSPPCYLQDSSFN
jgi:hypothetical protein